MKIRNGRILIFSTLLMLGGLLTFVTRTQAAPNNIYLVTSSSNAAITTCAGGANDCSLRGAVQLANATGGSDTINFSPSVTSISLSSSITLTDNGITIHGNGQEATQLKTTGNFAALVVNSTNNNINGLWINASLSHAGAGQHGIVLNGTNNVVQNNSLSDLGGDGVQIWNDYNTIQNNVVGVQTIGGTQWASCSFPNDQWGIAILNGSNNMIHHNTIACSGQDGVVISGPNATANSLYNNFIGVSNLGARMPNTLAGIAMLSGAHDNLIGTGTYATKNIIGANKTFGVYIGGSGTNGNILSYNWFGISNTISSMINISNTIDGVTIQAGAQSNQLISNVFYFNGGDGVFITGNGTNNNQLSGNDIAYQSRYGVEVRGGASNNQIGTSSNGNIILGNDGFGVYICDAGTNTNMVQRNSIGIQYAGNTLDGVKICTGAQSNKVLTNTISSNGGKGVYLTGAGTTGNILQANTIVTNSITGVVIDGGASGNIIGPGGPRSAGNVISANAADGVYIGGATTAFNGVYGNYIGTNAAGNVVNPNAHTGVVLDAGSHDNLIGLLSTERNVIAGNGWAGVAVVNGAHDNHVVSNDIGTNRDFPAAMPLPLNPARPLGGGASNYIPLPNGNDGIYVGGAFTNSIGGYILGVNGSNFVAYNAWSGIYVPGGSQYNVIGINEIHHNGYYGVLFDGNNTAYNTITRTMIYSNGLDGIGERNNAGFNVWTEVGVHDNGGLGIDKNASNDAQNIVNPPPNLTIDSVNRATGVVQGHADPSVLGTTKVELYRVSPDPSGFGEGGVFVGRTTTDASGNWTITDPSPSSGTCYTAFVTESQLVIPFSSSEFSANTCRVFLPLTIK